AARLAPARQLWGDRNLLRVPRDQGEWGGGRRVAAGTGSGLRLILLAAGRDGQHEKQRGNGPQETGAGRTK
ncbi:MAG: hypothetical protein ACTHL1_01875, partial [Burkholderiaceae bacterium]